MLSIELVGGVTLAYVLFLFVAAYYAERRREEGRSIISNPVIYSISISVYLTSWTYYGSVGEAATNGLDYLLIYLGPSLTAFSWWFLLRKIVRISKNNNITSIADFISSRYGKSQLLGAVIAMIAIIGNMPYIALQLKAVSTSFQIISGAEHIHLPFLQGLEVRPAFLAAVILSTFSVIFGARLLSAAERHEGLVAAIAVESIVKLFAFITVGLFVTYFLFDGFRDIFEKARQMNPEHLRLLTTFGEAGGASYSKLFTMLYLSMGAIMLLPRQFHIMVIENTDEQHIKKAMWLFPSYMFLINLFVMPIALGGILYSGSANGADYFVLTLPIQSNNHWLALLAFLGGFSAAAGMVMVASVATSTMFLNHLVMPFVVNLKPRAWFPVLLTTLKRSSIFLIIFLGYFYQDVVGETHMLVNIGLISFAAVAQFGPALVGGLYWRRGNKVGALTGLCFGFVIWAYTLLLPSFIHSGWLPQELLDAGPFGLSFLRPTQLFGLTGFDIWTHSLFWSLFFNIGSYLAFSILIPQDEVEREQSKKFIDVFQQQKNGVPWETKRLSKPITLNQFINLMSKFIGEPQSQAAIREYLGHRKIDNSMGISEFELPKLKRFTEKTLAGSVGAAAAGAIVESYLSDVGSKMEPVYDIFSTVRASLDESRENLYVRLRASEIMNRTLDLQIIMDDLIDLILKEFKLDLGIIWLKSDTETMMPRSWKGSLGRIPAGRWTAIDDKFVARCLKENRPVFVNDTNNLPPTDTPLAGGQYEGVRSFAHIPVSREGEAPLGILSIYSRSIPGLFTEQFLRLLGSLAGQLAQAVKIVSEMEAREREREEKERAQVEKARVMRDMELAKQIQSSLLPANPPQLKGARFSSLCVQATLVGGDYYDFFYQAEDEMDLVIADVSGHSVGAALIMVEARSVLRAQIHSALSASDILSILNDLLYEDLNRAELFISMFYVKYNSSDRSLKFANAGHNTPLLFRNGEPCQNLDAEGLILGVKKDVLFEEKSLELQKHDILLLYTDGITEAQNRAGELFGIDRLCEVLRYAQHEEPDAIIAAIIKAVEAFSGTKNFQDDISLVIMKVD